MADIIQNKEGTILEIVRMSTEDGPGIRTTVFFKGCSLKCSWCHNPESISFKPEIQWIESGCIGCKTCIAVCPESALEFTVGGISIDREKCTGCGICTEECPTKSMELMGKKYSVDDLVKELIKDKVYFEKSDGGVTVSGGEPGMQAEFTSQLLKKLKEIGIHTAFDTCGQVTQKSLEMILPYADLVLFDLKEIDPVKHNDFTGVDNNQILENFKFTINFTDTHLFPKAIWVRTPLIPDATATVDNLTGIGKIISENWNPVIKKWELSAFNNLCKDKYLRLGTKWKFHDYELMEKEFVNELFDAAKKSSTHPEIVEWNGSIKMENQIKKEEKNKNIPNPVNYCKLT